MKRVVSFICLITMLFGIVAVNAEPFAVTLGNREKNPLLEFPIDKKTIMNGGSLITEAENWILDGSVMAVKEDANASGGLAISVTAGGWADTPEKVEALKNPSFMLDFVCDSIGFYDVWAYVKSSGGREFSYYYVSKTGASPAWFTPPSAEYYWVKIAGQVQLGKGMQNVAFKYRSNNFTIDKIIITKDTEFAPVNADDKPQLFDTENGSSFFAAPPYYPEKGVHPRVYINAEDIPEIKANLNSPLLATTWKTIQHQAAKTLDCKLDTTKVGNNDNTIIAALESRAFMYLIGEADAAFARQTIDYAKEYISTVNYNMSDGSLTRHIGHQLVMTAVVYDWCYDQLTEEDKEFFIRKTEEFAAMKEVGYPPIASGGFIGGHGAEGEVFKDLLSVSIAFYDEEPEMYNLSAGRFFEKMVAAHTLYGDALVHTQGNAYGNTRYEYSLHAHKLMEAMGVEDVFGENYTKIPYQWLYERLPMGLWFKYGDDFNWSYYKPFAYYNTDNTALAVGADTLNDPYLMGEYLRESSIVNYSAGEFPIFRIIFSDPNVETKPVSELPLVRKTGWPLTSLVARTSWQAGLDSPAVMVDMNMKNVHLGDHMHNDVGAFQIYYKGMLALDSGKYEGANGAWGSEHFWNYAARSVAHNVMLVYDPDEQYLYHTTNMVNDGGQRSIWMYSGYDYDWIFGDEAKMSEEKATYIGPNEYTPEFTYIKSDLKYAYTDKVSGYERAMVFMDLFEEDYPAAFVVFDRIESSNKDFKKTWLLHSQLEPQVDGNVTTIIRDDNGFNGKLVNVTMLPSTNTIEKIGGPGHEFEVDGKNYPNDDSAGSLTDSGAWRIELSPKNAANEDLFLNAMYVTDADRNLPQLPMYKEEGINYVGVTVKDRMVTFSNSENLIKGATSLAVRNNGYDTVSCLITDVENGVWSVSDGTNEFFVESKEGENSLYFKTSPGTYTLKPAPDGKPAEITYPQMPKAADGDFTIYDSTNKLIMYQPKPVKLINGVAYFPVADMAYNFDATTEVNGNSVTLARNDSVLTITADTVNCTLDGNASTLKNAPVMINGTLYAAFDDFERFFEIVPTYDEYAKLLKIGRTVMNIPGLENLQFITPVAVTASSDDGNLPDNAIDLNLDSRWSSYPGTDEWIMFDLGAEYALSKVLIAFYVGDKRSTNIEIEYSTDGETWRKAYEGASGGKSVMPEEFNVSCTARYVRINCRGNNLNLYNSITEVIFPK